jgi:hypothetical protein
MAICRYISQEMGLSIKMWLKTYAIGLQMTIDLTKEEWEFLRKMCTRAVALSEMGLSDMRDADYYKAKGLLEKLIRGPIK